MKVNMKDVVGRLRIGEGQDAFTLRVKAPDYLERAAILDAISSQSFEVLQRILGRMVIGWEDVESPDGMAIPFDRMGDDGRPVNVFDKFLGAIPIERQFEVNVALLAFVGLHLHASRVAQGLSSLIGKTVDIRPIGEPGKNSSESTSTGS